MLPAKRRAQSKRIVPASRSVVLSSEPILAKDAQKSGGSAPAPETEPDTTIPRAQTGSAGHSSGDAKASFAQEQPQVLATAASSSWGGGEQYTYVTDDSGYTWLYDTVYGQYYYYDPIHGTYVPYVSADDGGAGHTEAGPVEGTSASAPSEEKAKHHKKRRIVRMAGGEVWEDPTLDDWPENDYRLFAGNLGPDVTSELLEQTFGKFRSLQRTHVVREKKTGKSRGYGFLSFGDASDFLAAWKEFDDKYVGSPPIKLRKSAWKSRNADIRKVKRVDKRAFLEYKNSKR